MLKKVLPNRSTRMPTIAFVVISLYLPAIAAFAAEATVYKDPQCGCCAKWVDHLKGAGFEVTVHDVPNIDEIKKQQGIPTEFGSCHTAVIDGYKVEGHVPVSVIQRLLKERPKIDGIAVPGMPMGSPGMEGPRRMEYDVMTFGGSEGPKVYEHIK
jgi:hypothetical protein